MTGEVVTVPVHPYDTWVRMSATLAWFEDLTRLDRRPTDVDAKYGDVFDADVAVRAAAGLQLLQGLWWWADYVAPADSYPRIKPKAGRYDIGLTFSADAPDAPAGCERPDGWIQVGPADHLVTAFLTEQEDADVPWRCDVAPRITRELSDRASTKGKRSAIDDAPLP